MSKLEKKAQKMLQKREVQHTMSERFAGQNLSVNQQLEMLMPDILALRRVGYNLMEISKLTGYRYKDLNTFILVHPEYSEIACTREYREEFIISTLMDALRKHRLSEAGVLKLYDLTLKAGLYEVRQKIARMELAIREAEAEHITGKEFRNAVSNILEVENVTSNDLDTVMKELARQGNRTAVSPFVDGHKDARLYEQGLFTVGNQSLDDVLDR